MVSIFNMTTQTKWLFVDAVQMKIIVKGVTLSANSDMKYMGLSITSKEDFGTTLIS